MAAAGTAMAFKCLQSHPSMHAVLGLTSLALLLLFWALGAFVLSPCAGLPRLVW